MFPDRNHTDRLWGRTSNNGQTAQTADTLPAILRVVLNNGIEMPQLGVGTSTLKETAAECVKHAIGLGYRLVDAAQGYDNEAEVWYGIKESGIGRSEVFIISKVSPDAVRSGKVRESLDRTIEAFGGTYVDLMLIHWSVARKVKERWRIMEKYVDVGKIRAIGGATSIRIMWTNCWHTLVSSLSSTRSRFIPT